MNHFVLTPSKCSFCSNRRRVRQICLGRYDERDWRSRVAPAETFVETERGVCLGYARFIGGTAVGSNDQGRGMGA